MHNAHRRMGRLTFVRRSRDTITDVSVFLERLVAESDDERSSILHLVSVFGGDQEIGAVLAAAQEGLRFQITFADSQLTGTLGEKPVIYRSSIQVPGRKRPARHAILLSRAFYDTTFGANAEARKTVLFDASPEFVLHRLAVRFGLPVLPEWAGWFHSELVRRKMIKALTGLNCSPAVVKGTKLRLLRILSQGLRRRDIRIPTEQMNGASPG